MQKITSGSNALEVYVGERIEPGAVKALREPGVVERAMRRRFCAEYVFICGGVWHSMQELVNQTMRYIKRYN